MKLKFLLLMITLCTVPYVVRAKQVYFTNSNNVSLSQDEYNYLVERFNERFPEIMTQEDYENLKIQDFINKPIKSISSNQIMPLGSIEHSSNSKNLKVSSTCTASLCSISVVLKWFNLPKTKSYDVIGAYLENTSLLSNPVTTLADGNDRIVFSDVNKQNNGFGVSVELTKNPLFVEIYQYYDVKPGGTIYQSYQHATSNVSYNDSKKYTISPEGFGRVFLFDNSVRDKYDQMGGVILPL